MKKYIYILCGILSGVFASCSQNVPEEDIPLSNQTILKVVADEGLQTRGTATGVDHFAIEVYTDATYENTANVFENGKTNKGTSATGEFAMMLDRTQEYYCLLWANKGGSTAYDLTSLKAVALTGKATEAWHGTKKIAAAADASLTATLTRAVSKITLLETGKLKAGTVKLNFDQPTTFNVADGTTTGTATARPEETVTIAADVDGSTTPAKLNTADIFVLSSVAIADVTNLTLQYADEDAFTVSNVPLKANFNTNIKGHYSTAKAGPTFTVSCDNTWGNPDNEGEIKEPVKYAVGNLYPSADNAVGVVYYTSSNETYGYVLSMDETEVDTWDEGLTWVMNKQDGGFTWKCPTKDELQYLWCAYNGASPVTWTGKADPCPAANTEKQAEFNAKLTTALGAGSNSYYWTSTEDADNVWSIRFSNGLTVSSSKGSKPTCVRAITIFGSAPTS